jgi:hypothetical protein
MKPIPRDSLPRRKPARRRQLVLLSLASALAVLGCASAPESNGNIKVAPNSLSNPQRSSSGAQTTTRIAAVPSLPAGQLSYYGGPVVEFARVIVVPWNANVDSRIKANLGSFFLALGNSELWKLVRNDYSTSIKATAGSHAGSLGTQQTIEFIGGWTNDPLAISNTTNLQDSDFQQALLNYFKTEPSVQPGVDDVYVITMPPGSSFTSSDGQHSCQLPGICGYHGHFNYNGVDVKYAVLADVSQDCAGLCGSDSDYLNNATSVASHELIETVTDPLVQNLDYPAGWTGANGEIGDLCNQQQGILAARKPDGTHWVTQKMYDNNTGSCVAPCTPLTCANVPGRCNSIDDTCGGTINCACATGVCVGNNPGKCCAPRTTCDRNMCGSISDGCGGTLSCGDCPQGQLCAGNFCHLTSPPPLCDQAACNQNCHACNGSTGSCGTGNCVCSSNRHCS